MVTFSGSETLSRWGFWCEKPLAPLLRQCKSSSSWAKAAFRWIPGAAKKHREQLFQAQEDLFQYYERGSQKNWEFRTWLVMQMRERLDKKLWRKVVPKYPAGCKRVLLSDDYAGRRLSTCLISTYHAGKSFITQGSAHEFSQKSIEEGAPDFW